MNTRWFLTFFSIGAVQTLIIVLAITFLPALQPPAPGRAAALASAGNSLTTEVLSCFTLAVVGGVLFGTSAEIWRMRLTRMKQRRVSRK
jgi:hypothetical protein